MSATVILMIVIVILLLTSRVIGLNTGKHPPGPFSWPFIGNKFLLNRLTRKLGAQHLAFLELSKRYSSNVITLQIGISKIIIVSGNKFIRSMLHNEDFDGRPWNEFIKMRNLGKKQGVTMNDGSDWKELRTWIMQALKIFGFGKYRMSEMIKEELTVILEKLKEGGVRRLKPVIAPAVINVLWTITTGKRFTEGPRLQYFMDLLDRRSRVFDMVGGLLTTFPWIRYIAPEASGYNLLLTLNNELKDFLLEIIAEHKQNYVVGGEVDLIDMFIEKMNKEDPSNLLYNGTIVTKFVEFARGTNCGRGPIGDDTDRHLPRRFVHHDKHFGSYFHEHCGASGHTTEGPERNRLRDLHRQNSRLDRQTKYAIRGGCDNRVTASLAGIPPGWTTSSSSRYETGRVHDTKGQHCVDEHIHC
ncbi:putative cytochrome P450 305a1 isoform X2 [Ptiloglossa arizonensis]|uniref:putative cytochrome P450 305a1 isoform X2 n=1 Tax=Ptiloglossa arizonensis TaxID=3350558 RepID=UPI003F9ECAE7